jgi:hypothetical protein
VRRRPLVNAHVVGADGCRSRVCAHARPHRRCVRIPLLSGASLLLSRSAKLKLFSRSVVCETDHLVEVVEIQGGANLVKSCLNMISAGILALVPRRPAAALRTGTATGNLGGI